MGTLSNFITDVIELVVKNPQHLVRFKTTPDNPFLSPREMLRMFTMPGVMEDFTKANLVVSTEEDSFDTCIVGVGYSDVVADRVRKFYANRTELSIFLDVFQETTIVVPSKDGFQIDGSRTQNYQTFLDNLEVKQPVRCTLYGPGIVYKIDENCCDNEALKPGDKPVRIVTVHFSDNFKECCYLNGHPINVAYIGNTLYPLT